MSTISVTTSGNTDKMERFLQNLSRNWMFDSLEAFGQEGVAALELATPRDTGVTAGSWYYQTVRGPGGASISWHNSSVDSRGTPIVVLLQYGHATGNGGYVAGQDFINQAMEPVFRNTTDMVWKVVQS